jgi:lysophospholipase L1-like esterase
MKLMTRHVRYIAAFAILCASLTASGAETGPRAHWVGVWAAAPRELAVPAAEQSTTDTTYRDIVHITMGGYAFKVQITNEFGATPLKIDGVHVALSAGDGSIKPGTDHALAFGGRPSVTIPSGAYILSDAVALDAPAFADLSISIFVPAQTIKYFTIHPLGTSTTYKVAGNALDAVSLKSPARLQSWYLLKGVEVVADPKAAAIVTLGDSITDGRSSTPDANRRWPDMLALRLQADKRTSNLSVLNEGISGNRVLHDFDGPSALARLDRDVLAQPGVKYLVILESINDIGRNVVPRSPGEIVTAQDLIFGLMQLVTRAHQHDIKVLGATLTPYEGAAYFSPEGEQIRQTINAWIRTSGVFDGVIDFDKAVQDTSHPSRFLPGYDDGHHLHPNDAGYKAMAAAVNLQLFQ